MIRAGKSIVQEHAHMDWDERVFLVGYSEGGYATMAATKWIQEHYDQELTITGTAPMAGPYNLSGVMKSIITGDTHYAHLAFLAYLAFGYDVVYNLFDSISEVFRLPNSTDLPPLMDGGTQPGRHQPSPSWWRSEQTECIVHGVFHTEDHGSRISNQRSLDFQRPVQLLGSSFTDVHGPFRG